MLGCRFAQIWLSEPGLGFSTCNSLVYSVFQSLHFTGNILLKLAKLALGFFTCNSWVYSSFQPLHFTLNYLLKPAKKGPPRVAQACHRNPCWLQRTLVPSNVSLFAEGRFMGSFTRETRFSHFGLQPTASLYHHCRCLTGFSHYGLQPTANYVTNLGASLVLATLASGPLLAASSWELLACSSCPPWAPSVSW